MGVKNALVPAATASDSELWLYFQDIQKRRWRYGDARLTSHRLETSPSPPALNRDPGYGSSTR
jgi:hypothetical protein